MTTDFNVLRPLLELCQKHQVSFTVTYNEHDHTWCVTIDSAAPSERYSSRDYSVLEMSVDSAIAFIKNGFK